MPQEGNKVLKYNHGEKSMEDPFIVFADLDSLLVWQAALKKSRY